MNLRTLDDLVAQGETLLEARRNPSDWVKSLGDFGDAYQRWNIAGKDLIARLSGPAASGEWSAGRCHAMYSLDQDREMCLKEHERQQAMLTALRARYEASAAKRISGRETGPLPSLPAPPVAATSAVAPKAGKGPFVIRPDNRELTNEQVLGDIQRVAAALNKKKVTLNEYLRHGKCNSGILMGRFGSWNKAVAAAGLEIVVRQNIPTEELFENLARVWEALGRQPVHLDMFKPLSAFSTYPYESRFGGWRRALRAFALWAHSGKIPEEADAPPSAEPRRKSPPTSLRLRFTCIERDGFKCVACGRSPATHPGVELQADHITPRSKNGLTVLTNLRTLCKECNVGRGNMDPL